MASDDLKIIKKIKKLLKITLPKRDEERFSGRGYAVNAEEKVTALGLPKSNLSTKIHAVCSLIKALGQLQQLNLDRNKISDLSALKELSQLQQLNLDRNKINDLSALKGLSQLQILYLSDNEISDISALKELSQLQQLNLNFNKISDLSALKALSQLQQLDLSRNQLSDISALKALDQLQQLDLSFNEISDLSYLKELSQLQQLHLSRNQLSDLSALKGLGQLQILYLSDNKISDLSVLKNLKHLKYVELLNNRIAKLPAWITELKPETVFSDEWKFKTINVYNNPLTHPPPEIIHQGRDALRAYFRSLEGETVKLHEAKVLLVGDGKAGKTSLLKQFQGLPFDEHESQTHGISVLSVNAQDLPDCVPPDTDCRLHFWDFGGQEIMHASHRFFMSKRAVYILVLDSRDDTEEPCWRWLRHIEKYGGPSPSIVVMNKIDQNPAYNIQQKKINDRFPAIANRFFRISCKKREGREELVRSLSAAVPKTLLYGFDISTAWLRIRKRLEEATGKQHYINQQAFIAICQEEGVKDETSRMTLLKLFHDLGTVLFFEDLKLVDIYVLDPHWVTVGVYKIINSGKTKDGLLHEQDLDYILNTEPIRCEEYDPAREAKKDLCYTRSEERYLVDIMKEFELCYPYGEHWYILPGKLPKELEPEPKLHGKEVLRFLMEYDFLPSSLFPRLMVRLQGDIRDQKQQWRYGISLKNKEFDVQALVQLETQNNRISISIQGEAHRKREYLSVLRHHIAGIAKDFEGLELTEWVPLPGYEDVFVKYKELLGLERLREKQYVNGELGKKFSVSQLLDSVVTQQERSEEGSMIHVHLDNIGNSNVTNTQTNTQSQHQDVEVKHQIKEMRGLFRNLKEDILSEADIEIEDAKEKQRIENELNTVEKALVVLEESATAGEKPETAVTSRLEKFFQNLADKTSRLGKVLETVDHSTEKVRNLVKIYNKFAQNIGLPSIPFLGKD